MRASTLRAHAVLALLCFALPRAEAVTVTTQFSGFITEVTIQNPHPFFNPPTMVQERELDFDIGDHHDSRRIINPVREQEFINQYMQDLPSFLVPFAEIGSEERMAASSRARSPVT